MQIININVILMNSFSSYIFLANSLNTFNNSKNFKKDIIEFIQNTSPMLANNLLFLKRNLLD